MSQFTCPSCNGGFPEPEPGDPPTCPWCGAAMDGTGSVLDPPKTGTIDVDTSSGSGTFEPREINSSASVRPGVVSCPECGGPMPLTAYVGRQPLCQDCQRSKRMEHPGPIQDGEPR